MIIIYCNFLNSLILQFALFQNFIKTFPLDKHLQKYTNSSFINEMNSYLIYFCSEKILQICTTELLPPKESPN